jgi:hypothetical protein
VPRHETVHGPAPVPGRAPAGRASFDQRVLSLSAGAALANPVDQRISRTRRLIGAGGRSPGALLKPGVVSRHTSNVSAGLNTPRRWDQETGRHGHDQRSRRSPPTDHRAAHGGAEPTGRAAPTEVAHRTQTSAHYAGACVGSSSQKLRSRSQPFLDRETSDLRRIGPAHREARHEFRSNARWRRHRLSKPELIDSTNGLGGGHRPSPTGNSVWEWADAQVDEAIEQSAVPARRRRQPLPGDGSILPFRREPPHECRRRSAAFCVANCRGTRGRSVRWRDPGCVGPRSGRGGSAR